MRRRRWWRLNVREKEVVAASRAGAGSHERDHGSKAARAGRLVVEHATVWVFGQRRKVLGLVGCRWRPLDDRCRAERVVRLAIFCAGALRNDVAGVVHVGAIPRVWLHEDLVTYGRVVVDLGVNGASSFDAVAHSDVCPLDARLAARKRSRSGRWLGLRRQERCWWWAR